MSTSFPAYSGSNHLTPNPPPMAFDAANNNSTPSRSLFRKTVELQDWWLTKPQTADDDDDDETKTLGVAGLTCTSQKTQAGRCFSSAPILKVHDIFELETDDGVSVILKGYINKDRTLENGFSPEVFDHFVIGFPDNWKEFSTSCPKRESAANCMSSVNEDSIEEHVMAIGVQDCEDTILSNKPSTVIEIAPEFENVIKVGHDVLCEKYPVTPEFENGSIVRNVVDSCTGSKCLKVSSRRMTRSMAKMNNNSPNTFNLGSCDTLKMDKNDALPNNKAANGVGCDMKSESRKIFSKSNETANCFENTVLMRNPKRKQKGQNVGVNEDLKDKLKSPVAVGISNQGEIKDADVSGESEIDPTTRSDLEAKRFKSDVNDDLVLLRTNMKSCKNKKKNKEGVAAKKAVMTRSKSKSKLTPGNSNCKMAKKEVITSPKSPPSRAKKGFKEEHGSYNILSPESFSGKKSRSGRVLLPTLEFWRNQRVVYDEDGELCGVQEPK